MSVVSEIWSVLTPSQRRRVLSAQLLSILMALSTVVGVASIAPFFAVMGNPRLIEQNALLHRIYSGLGFSGTQQFAAALGVAFVMLVVATNLLNVAGSFRMARLAFSIGAEFQSTLLREYLTRPYLFHARTHSAVLAARVGHEAARVTHEVLQNVLSLVTSIATGGLILAAVVVLNPPVAIAMIVLLAGGYCLIYLSVRNRLLRIGRIQSQLLAEQSRLTAESLGGVRDILIRRMQGYFIAGFDRTSQALAGLAAHVDLIGRSPRNLMECVVVAAVGLLVLLVGERDAGIGGGLGQLTFLGFAAYRLLPALQQAFAAVVKIRGGRSALAEVAADLRLARARREIQSVPDSSWHGRPEREIRLSAVSFRYAPDRPWAIEGASLCIPAGAAVGIVGANGSGKTTLVDLIAGLLIPESGRIEVDGVTLGDDNRSHWQSRLAYVPQSIFLLDATIEENIAFGVPAEKIDRERLKRAAQLARLDGVVAALPGGYAHRVGERGVTLSGGQRQRIGIARALYMDASVLIMDEATSAQDGLTERELVETILGLRQRYTILLIAHRLSSAGACDLILELDAGRVSGRGTYSELLRDSESFRRLTGLSRGAVA